MFNHGLEYVRADFHLHTRKDKEFDYRGEENSFVKSYVSALKDANIQVGVITNHNKFDFHEYKAIRRTANKENIFILPGVELSIKEGANGIHALIVFNPDEWLENGESHINTFLTTVFAGIPDYENRNVKSKFDLKAIFEALDAYGKDYFIIFAHVDSKSGLFKECRGGVLQTLSTLTSFNNRVLGLQKSRDSNKLNQFREYFHYVPALIESSDPKSLEEIGQGKQTYIKIGEFSFNSIKFALQDYHNRVISSIPGINHVYIESITFKGGKFDGQTITFSSALNSIIGIRGSGKSSVLEVIRYVLKFEPQVDREYKDSLITNILGPGGKAILSIVNKQGKRYQISRILNENPKIHDEDGEVLEFAPLSLFNGVQYFGQKDLANSANRENNLLDKLITSKIDLSNTESYVEELIKAAESLFNINKTPSQLEEVHEYINELEHKLSVFEERGVATKLEKQGAFATDEAKIETILEKLRSELNDLQNRMKNVPEFSLYLNDDKSKYNKELFEKIYDKLLAIDLRFKKISSYLSEIEEFNNEVDTLFSSLKKQISDLSEEFADIQREIKDETLDLNSFVKMTSDLEKSKERLKQLEDKISSQKELKKIFSNAVKNRKEILVSEYKAYETEIEKINKSQEELQIEILFQGDKDDFKNQLKSDFKGTGINEVKYKALSHSFSDYVDLIEDWLINDGKLLREILTPNEFGKFEDRLLSCYQDLIKRKTKNSVDIYYHGKLLRQHSIGQRASALLLFILTQSNNDVILIDQPEDDLDSKVIYHEVISAIIQNKSDVQFIFATHNANITVLGDSERVLACEYQETKINVDQGNIDMQSSHKQIVDIMEGGREAFKKRQKIYNGWN